jgi:hypothetical protein
MSSERSKATMQCAEGKAPPPPRRQRAAHIRLSNSHVVVRSKGRDLHGTVNAAVREIFASNESGKLNEPCQTGFAHARYDRFFSAISRS